MSRRLRARSPAGSGSPHTVRRPPGKRSPQAVPAMSMSSNGEGCGTPFPARARTADARSAVIQSGPAGRRPRAGWRPSRRWTGRRRCPRGSPRRPAAPRGRTWGRARPAACPSRRRGSGRAPRVRGGAPPSGPGSGPGAPGNARRDGTPGRGGPGPWRDDAGHDHGERRVALP